MDRTEIEKRISELLISLYAGKDYKALIAATAIVDILQSENLIRLNNSQITSAKKD